MVGCEEYFQVGVVQRQPMDSVQSQVSEDWTEGVSLVVSYKHYFSLHNLQHLMKAGVRL